LTAAPELIRRGPEVAQLLAEYLGGIKSDGARELLWQMASRTDIVRELLLQPGDPDGYGRDLASLPYALAHAYGDRVVPFLERAVTDSPYPFVRTQSAKELAIAGRPVAFRFFLDALENNRFYKQELITWLKGRFPEELSSSADDLGVMAFCKTHLK
jgi:hypothetical protein